MCYNSDMKEKRMNINENCEFVQKNIEREVQQCIILKQKSNAKAQMNTLKQPMEIVKNIDIDLNKRTIFLDVDDVLLDSSAAVVAILNQRYGLNKTLDDLVDWGYKSIYRNLTKEQVSEIYESEKFWSLVKPNEILMKALEDSEEDEQGIWRQYNWILLTKGSKESLQKKLDYLNKIPFFKRNESKWRYFGLGHGEKKEDVHMLGRIQIDDNYSFLNRTDADLKILVRNGKETRFNRPKVETENLENLYIVDNISQVFEILEFITKLDTEDIDLDGFDIMDMITEVSQII